MNKLISRPEYLNQLIENKDVALVKIVTGIRRCGKSSLLNICFSKHQRFVYQSIYIKKRMPETFLPHPLFHHILCFNISE